MALSQEIVQAFRDFSGTADEFKEHVKQIVLNFDDTQVQPYVGKLTEPPDYSLLIAVRQQSEGKLWAVKGRLVSDSNLYECIGIGAQAAQALLARLYPLYPTLDSIAVLATYVIYRVKNTVEGCGLQTEIRFVSRDRLGIVPPERIEAWESLFRRYERLERDVFYQAMAFIPHPPLPPRGLLPEEIKGLKIPPQFRSLSEIRREIDQIRRDVAKLPIFLDRG
jgi:hypothetical protein